LIRAQCARIPGTVFRTGVESLEDLGARLLPDGLGEGLRRQALGGYVFLKGTAGGCPAW
jgi:hypothetical protein